MPLTALARLRLLSREEGGLEVPLKTPTPSLVLREVTQDGLGPGLVAVIKPIGTESLEAGNNIDARLVFPIRPAETRSYLETGKRFALWDGAVVGWAEIRRIDS